MFDIHQEGSGALVDRPPVPDSELGLIMEYLTSAPQFLVERGRQTDLLDGAQDVPVGFHTDGAWIWPADVAHYLHKHGVAPDPGLLERIRRRQFQLPELDDVTVAEAEATITGAPVPLAPLEQRLGIREAAELAALARLG